jgi:putative transcriptional regulator
VLASDRSDFVGAVWKAGLVSQPFHTGRLLVATPSIEGDVFGRSVVLLLHHDEAGAQGVVLNKPLTADVDSVLPGWQRVVTAPPVLFQGGPVSTSSALGLVTVPGDEPEPLGVKRLFGSIGLVDLDVPTPVVAAELAGMRIFAGYSGWEAGQLEGEIRRGDWYVVDAEVRDPFTPDPDGLWREVLRRQRDSLAFVASFPDDPSMN